MFGGNVRSTGDACIPKIVINSALANKDGLLNILHLNACSMLNKMNYLKEIIIGAKVQAICISETWLNNDISNGMVKLEGFKLIRNDRCSSSRGGGVCIYIRKDINYKTLHKSNGQHVVEYLFLELNFPSSNVILGVVYNAQIDDFSEFEHVLRELSMKYPDIVIAGDFNINLLVNNRKSRSFVGMFDQYSMSIVNSHPTHFQLNSQSSSCIDLFVTSDQKNVSIFTQVAVPGISHHDLICLSYKINIGTALQKSSYYRDYKNINIENLLLDGSLLPWNDIYNSSDVNNQLQHFNMLVLKLYEKHVPLKKCKPSAPVGIPWLNNELQKAFIEKNLAYSAWRRSRTSDRWKNYKRLNQIAIDLEHKLKIKYYEPRFNTSLQSRTLWKNLKELGINSKGDNDCSVDPYQLNSFFASNFNHTGLASSKCVFSAGDRPNSFYFRNVTIDEVILATYKLKSNAIGADGICLRFIKMLMPIIIPFFTHILNTTLTQSVFPSLWKLANITPLPKVSSPKLMEDFRPISILPILSKVLEVIMKDQMNDFIDSNNLLSPFQSGFRKHYSTVTSLASITNDISSDVDKKKLNLIVLLDFSKAFDKVIYSKLCKKLYDNFNFSSTAVKMIESYLNDRFQLVKLDKMSSDWLPVVSGVPQGSVLGPLLFSIFINDLPDCIRYSDCNLFADDVQLRISDFPNVINEAISRMNSDLQEVNVWSKRNGLVLNPKKSQAILIYNKIIDSSLLNTIQLNGEIIPFVSKIKNLGLTINQKLGWTDHVNNLCGRVYGCLRRLWKIANVIPTDTKKYLIKSLLLPCFTYAGEVYFTALDSISKRKIDVTFNACTRFVYNLRKFDHVSCCSSGILGCNIHQYLEFRVLVFIYKIIKVKKPAYLFQKLIFGKSNRMNILLTPIHSTTFYGCTLFIRGIALWNALPTELKSVHATTMFKKLCFKFICE